MRKFPRFVSKQIGWFVPANYLFRISTPVFLPFYHVVSNEKLSYILNYNFRDVALFEKELDFFLKYFSPVSLEFLLKNPAPGRKVFHLSFDDGLKECSEIIAPILLKKGIPATFFVNPGFVDNRKLFHRYKASLILSELQKKPDSQVQNRLNELGLNKTTILKTEISQTQILDEVARLLGINFNLFLEKQKPYLSTNQILELKKQGFSIGSHSFSHPEFWTVSEQEQLQQIRQSMDWINKTVNPKIRAFAFPFTDSGVPASLLQTIKNENICDITFGTAGLKYDSFPGHFQRYPVETPGNFIRNIKSEWIYFQFRKWIGKATVKH